MPSVHSPRPVFLHTGFDPTTNPTSCNSDVPDLKKTPLHDRHMALGAKMVPFAGYDMPVQYTGIIEEHTAVRTRAGLFDVSHMGEVVVSGPSAFDFVQRLVTNDVASLYDGKALYTAMCKTEGSIVDDLLVYRFGPETYVLVINASRIEDDLAWMRANNPMNAGIENVSDITALMALQGPASLDILKAATGHDWSGLRFYHFQRPESFMGFEHVLVSRTGYTGEAGVEIYCPNETAGPIWDALMTAGESFGLLPAGLGARDTLRLESGFCLYGNDITLDTNPLEAGLGWLTKLDTGDFLGRDALLNVKEAGPSRRLVGFVAAERGIPRSGNDLCSPDGSVIGHVTSGTQSPVLSKGIGMGYVPNRPEYTTPGSELRVAARGRSFAVTVKKPPFHVNR